MKIYCNVCNKYRKSRETKILYIFYKTLSLSIVYSKCGHEYKKLFKEEESIEILKVLDLITDMEEYQKLYNHVWKSMSQEFRLEIIDETRNYFIEKMQENELMSKKHKKVCRVLNDIEHLLILVSAVTECVSISAFASLVGILIGITCSTIGLKISVITTELKSISQ